MKDKTIETEYNIIDSKFETFISDIRKANLVIIAGRPSTGKTKFALNLTKIIISKRECSIAIFSLELSKDGIFQFLFDVSQNGKDLKNITESDDLLNEIPVFIDDCPEIDSEYIQKKIKMMVKKSNLGFIIIDYLQLMFPICSMGKEEKNNELSKIILELNNIAKKFNVPIIVLSQLTREIENRVDKRPTIADLENSGISEKYADIIVFIYRESMNMTQKIDKSISDMTKVFIAKNKNGSIGEINLDFEFNSNNARL